MRYFLVSFYRKPGGQIDERVEVTKRVKTAHIQNSNIIMDFALKKIEKCVVEGKKHDTTFEQMRDYYERIYPQLIKQLEVEAPLSLDKNSKNGT